MTPLKVSECARGMKVVLVNKAYTPSKSNPVLGSTYECAGTIMVVFESDSFIRVRWDNKERNSYRNGDLALIDEHTQYFDIWDNI